MQTHCSGRRDKLAGDFRGTTDYDGTIHICSASDHHCWHRRKMVCNGSSSINMHRRKFCHVNRINDMLAPIGYFQDWIISIETRKRCFETHICTSCDKHCIILLWRHHWNVTTSPSATYSQLKTENLPGCGAVIGSPKQRSCRLLFPVCQTWLSPRLCNAWHDRPPSPLQANLRV